MNMRVMLLHLAIPVYTFGMLNQEALNKFVRSYEVVHIIPHDGERTHSLLYEPKSNQLIAAIDQDLIPFNCVTYEGKPTFIGKDMQGLTLNPDKNIFYGREASPTRTVFVGSIQDGACRVSEQPWTGRALAYNTTDKTLCIGGLHRNITLVDEHGQESSWNVLSGNNAYINNISAVCCNEAKNAIYVGSEEGKVEKWNTSGECVTKINAGTYISPLLCDQNSGHLYLNPNKRGILQRYDANLENMEEISYAGISTSTYSFTHNTISKLLCITSKTHKSEERGLEYNVHILHPDNPTIQCKISLSNLGQSVACNPINGTFYVGSKKAIYVLKPKESYLALANQSAHTVFKIKAKY